MAQGGKESASPRGYPSSILVRKDLPWKAEARTAHVLSMCPEPGASLLKPFLAPAVHNKKRLPGTLTTRITGKRPHSHSWNARLKGPAPYRETGQ